MPFSEGIKDMVLNGGSSADLKRRAIKDGMKTLRMSGITKVLEGMSAMEEVIKGYDGRLGIRTVAVISKD